MRKVLSFIVEGDPIAKGRPRFSTRGGFARAYTPKKTKDSENDIKSACEGSVDFHLAKAMFDFPVKMRVVFYFHIPKSTRKKDLFLYENDELSMSKKPDIDNLFKLVLDGLNGVAFRDDALVTDVIMKKRYSKNPRTEVSLIWD